MNKKSFSNSAVGLDIGSRYVRCVVGMQEPQAPAPSIIGVGTAANNGVRKGVVVDIEETVSAISQALDEAVRIAGINVNHATIGANGTHLITVGSHGIIAVGAGSREITEQDLARAEEAATVIQLPPNREIIQAFPYNYQVDGQEGVKDPIGMSAVRLEVDTLLVTAATPFIKNVARAVNQAGINIDGFLANPLAAALTVVDKNHRDQGTVLLDIGATTTGVAVYEEGDLLHVGILPIGGGHITNDLAIGLRTEIDVAEKVKLEHVNVSPKTASAHADRHIKIHDNGEELTIAQKEIDDIARARLEELFEMVNAELRKIKREGMLPGGAIICGGGANLRGLEDFAKQALRLPAHVGRPHGFSGIVDKVSDPAYATAIGLMLADFSSASNVALFSSAMSVVAPVKEITNRLLRRLKG